jgi:hypothetical protein
MNTRRGLLPLFLLAAGFTFGLESAVGAAQKVQLAVARIFIEFNHTDNDLGFHVFLDGEDWRTLKIIHPNGNTIFEVEGKGGFGDLGMTELFFEGAEPSLDEVPLEVLLGLFPEGKYRFEGETAAGEDLVGMATLTHKIPGAPVIVSPKEGETVDSAQPVVIDWDPVPDPQGGKITGYQVIVESFSITLPATKTRVTVPPEFLEPGKEYPFEVLAIEAGGNQTITASSFKTL